MSKSNRGEFLQLGNKFMTTYPEEADCMWDLVEDYYAASMGGNLPQAFAKSAGSAVWGDNGYTNTIYGKYITAAMFMSDNAFTSIGAKPYQHEGVRIATEAAYYGLATEEDIAAGLTDFAVGDFIGIGATTTPDGTIPGSVKMPVDEFREPAKEIPLKFNYGLYLAAVQNKDDVIDRKLYLDKISKNYSDVIDKTLLRPIYAKQPVKDGMETTINGLNRIVSGFKEIGRTVKGVTLDAEMVSPYGGRAPGKGDFYQYRSAGESNLDGQVVDAGGEVLSLRHMDMLYRDCMVNWDDAGAPNNKMWLMSNVARDKLGALMKANNILLNTVWTQRDFNGVKTMPGRDAGLALASYNNIPIIVDGNINFDYKTKKVSRTDFGDIGLYDLDHIWMSILTPVSLFSVNNPAITNILQEVNLIHMRGETRIDSFIGSGRIVGVADDTL